MPYPTKFKTNTEILNQVENLKYVSNKTLPIIRSIKVLMIYKTLVNILCPEDIYMLDKSIRSMGFINGVHQILMDAKFCLSSRESEKQNQIDLEESNRRFNKMAEEARTRMYIPEINEDELIKNLTSEQLKLRNQPYPNGIHYIPDDIIYNQPIIENGIEGEVEWMIFDKIHGCWFAVVTSPHRIKADGKKGCVLFRDINSSDLKQYLKIELIKEKNRQAEYMAARSKKPNISRVQNIMGVNCDSNLTGDDIF